MSHQQSLDIQALVTTTAVNSKIANVTQCGGKTNLHPWPSFVVGNPITAFLLSVLRTHILCSCVNIRSSLIFFYQFGALVDVRLVVFHISCVSSVHTGCWILDPAVRWPCLSRDVARYSTHNKTHLCAVSLLVINSFFRCLHKKLS